MMDWIGRLFEPSNNGTASARALLERIGLSPGASPPSVVDAIGAVDAEVGRARRYEYSLSIVVLETISLRAVSENGGNGEASDDGNGHTIETSLPQMVSLVAAAMLREALRESDVVCYQPTQDRFLLALAQSDEHAARTALRRIETLLADRLRLGVVTGIAHFPEDALTRAGLTAVAVSRARQAARRARSGVPQYRPRREAGVTPIFSATSAMDARGANGD